MRVAYGPLPVLGPPPAGRQPAAGRRHDDTRPRAARRATTRRASPATPSVIWGECPGEAESVVTRSSSFGAFAYPGRRRQPLELLLLRLRHGARRRARAGSRTTRTASTVPSPSPTSLRRWDAPQTLVWQGTRAALREPPGQPRRGLPPGATGRGRAVGRRRLRGGPGRDATSTARDGALPAPSARTRGSASASSTPTSRLRPLTPGTTVAAERQPLRRGPLRGPDDDGPPAAAEHRRDRRPALPAAREVPRRRRAATSTRRRWTRRR